MSGGEEQKKDKAKKAVGGPGYIETIIIVLIITVSCLFAYDKFYAQKIRTFDLKGFVQQQKKLLLAGDITEKQFNNNLSQLDEKLQTALKASHNRHQIILFKDVVLKNENSGQEITIK